MVGKYQTSVVHVCEWYGLCLERIAFVKQERLCKCYKTAAGTSGPTVVKLGYQLSLPDIIKIKK